MNKWIANSVCRWSVVVGVAILAGAAVIKWDAAKMPAAQSYPPAPAPLPSPNARDFYTRAGTMLMGPIDYVDFKQPPVPSGATQKQKDDPTSGFHVFTEAELDKIAEENQPAIRVLHDGMRYPYAQVECRSFRATFSYLATDRRMARCLRIIGKTEEAHGDWAEAASRYIDCMKLGGDLPHNGNIFALLVGIACDAIGRRALDPVIGHLDSRDARTDALRIAAIDADAVRASQTLKEQLWETQGSLLEIFRHKNWRKQLIAIATDQGDATNMPVPPSALVGGISTLRDQLALNAESAKTAYETYTGYMESCIAIAALPWPAQLDTDWPGAPRSPINNILVPEYSRAVYRQVATVALNRILETQLALHAYNLDHGTYPASLEALVPAYLPAVPKDPFSKNSLLRYKAKSNGRSYLLYSIGPDAIDNGGSPMEDDAYPQGKFLALYDSHIKGDIVAGVNH